MSFRVGEKAELEPAPSSIKSKVLKDFGFKVFFDDKGMIDVVKETVICPIVSRNYDTLSQWPISVFMSNDIIALCYWQCVDLVPYFVMNGNKWFQSSFVQRLLHLSVVCDDVSYRVLYGGTSYVPYREKMYHCSPNSAPLLQEMTCNVSEPDIGKTTP